MPTTVHTGDTAWLSSRYESLKPKLLARARARGRTACQQCSSRSRRTTSSTGRRASGTAIVFKPVNTVVNAFHIRSLQMMAEMAGALGKDERGRRIRSRWQPKPTRHSSKILFDPDKGAYRDGEGTDHMSQHASLFPLAFGLVPEEHVPAVAGMRRRNAAWPARSMPRST